MPAVSSHLPALVDHRHLRFAALYAAQGLPFGLFAVAIPAWLAAQGASAAEIGSYLAIATLPWSAKLLAGPLMDRFTFLPMDRRRPMGTRCAARHRHWRSVSRYRPRPGPAVSHHYGRLHINAFAANCRTSRSTAWRSTCSPRTNASGQIHARFGPREGAARPSRQGRVKLIDLLRRPGPESRAVSHRRFRSA